MKVAAIQYRPPKGQLSRAAQDLAVMVDQAGEQGATLIVCPEMASTGYVWDSAAEILPHCEPADGALFAALSPVAAKHRAWVQCGFAERVGEGAGAELYNSAMLVGPDGRLIATYRKMLLYSADERWAWAGTRRIAFRHAGKLVMPAICMDLNDDRMIAAMHLNRIEVLAFCTNWVEEGLDTWAYWRARLAGWGGVFVAANTWGTDRDVRFSGRSVIFGKGGTALASAGSVGDKVLVGDLG